MKNKTVSIVLRYKLARLSDFSLNKTKCAVLSRHRRVWNRVSLKGKNVNSYTDRKCSKLFFKFSKKTYPFVNSTFYLNFLYHIKCKIIDDLINGV